MNKRRVRVTLTLWTDAEMDCLQDKERWVRLLLGDNPSFTDLGREPQLGVQGVDATMNLPSAKKTKKKVAKR